MFGICLSEVICCSRASPGSRGGEERSCVMGPGAWGELAPGVEEGRKGAV